MLLFYLAVSKNVVKQTFLDFVDKNQVILKKKNLMCLTCRFAVEKCEVQLQGYDRWMKPLSHLFFYNYYCFVLILSVLSNTIWSLLSVNQTLLLFFYVSSFSAKCTAPVLQCLIRLVHIEHHVKSLTSAKSEDV